MRWLKVTPTGVALRDGLITQLVPDQTAVFAQWSNKDKTDIHRLLGRLKQQLDDNRDNVVLSQPT